MSTVYVCAFMCVSSDLGVKCGMYHAGMSIQTRTRVHHQFLRDELQVKLTSIVHVHTCSTVLYLLRIKLSCHFVMWCSVTCINAWDTIVFKMYGLLLYM